MSRRRTGDWTAERTAYVRMVPRAGHDPGFQAGGRRGGISVIPLMHDFAGETVLVFGGGEVGARKARRFAREARVVIVSPEFPAENYGRAECVRAAPTPRDAAGWLDRAAPALTVAATDDPDLNAAVEQAARKQGVLVNRADQAGRREAGSVVVPATVRDDPVVVAVATGGASPALARHLRKRIEEEIDDAGAMADLTADLRTDLKARGVPPERRRGAVRAVVNSSRVWKALGERPAKARQVSEQIVSDKLGEIE